MAELLLTTSEQCTVWQTWVSIKSSFLWYIRFIPLSDNFHQITHPDMWGILECTYFWLGLVHIFLALVDSPQNGCVLGHVGVSSIVWEAVDDCMPTRESGCTYLLCLERERTTCSYGAPMQAHTCTCSMWIRDIM